MPSPVPVRQRNERSAVLRHAERPPEQRLPCRRAQGHHHSRPDQAQLSVEPGPAGGQLPQVRRFVDTAFAAFGERELEVLHGVGDIRGLPVDPGLRQGFVQQLAGRADEGLAPLVLLVSGLLPDEDKPRRGCAFAEDGLGGVLVEGAAPALRRRTPERGEAARFGR